MLITVKSRCFTGGTSRRSSHGKYHVPVGQGLTTGSLLTADGGAGGIYMCI